MDKKRRKKRRGRKEERRERRKEPKLQEIVAILPLPSDSQVEESHLTTSPYLFEIKYSFSMTMKKIRYGLRAQTLVLTSCYAAQLPWNGWKTKEKEARREKSEEKEEQETRDRDEG